MTTSTLEKPLTKRISFDLKIDYYDKLQESKNKSEFINEAVGGYYGLDEKDTISDIEISYFTEEEERELVNLESSKKLDSIIDKITS